jgi:hypothetical protein
MVKDWSGRINLAARAFGVSELTHSLQPLRRPGRGQADQSLVDLAGDVAFAGSNDLPPAEALGGVSGHVAVGPFIKAQPGQHDGVEGVVRGAITAAVQPVPAGLAAAGRDRRSPHRWANAAWRAHPGRHPRSSVKCSGRAAGDRAPSCLVAGLDAA